MAEARADVMSTLRDMWQLENLARVVGSCVGHVDLTSHNLARETRVSHAPEDARARGHVWEALSARDGAWTLPACGGV